MTFSLILISCVESNLKERKGKEKEKGKGNFAHSIGKSR